MPWQTIVAIQLLAGNSIINSSGIFVYSSAPGAGNLLFSAAPAAGTDQFGNAFLAGAAVYGNSGSQFQLTTSAGVAAALLSTGDAQQVTAGFLNSAILGAGGTRQLETNLSSPVFTGNPAQLLLQSQSQDGTVNSQIQLVCVNKTVFGASGNAWWADGTQQLNLPASGGPFIFGEGFHNVSLAANWAGTFRVKKLPWNAILLDVELNATANTSGGVSITFGSLPDATYYPTIQRHFVLSLTGSSLAATGSFLGLPRVLMPTSGAVKIELPSLSASVLPTLACSVMYPTN